MPVKLPYVMEMPPAGGYPQIPYKRHIPVRGASMAMMTGFAFLTYGILRQHNELLIMEANNHCQETLHARGVWKPLIDAERRRHEVKRRKEYMEQLNLNLVATNIYPHLDPLRDIEGAFSPWQEWEGGKAVQDDWSGPDNKGLMVYLHKRPDGTNPMKRAMGEYMQHKGAWPVGP